MSDLHCQVSVSGRVFLSAAATCVLLQGVFDGDEVLQGFGHLAAGDGQVSGVQEVAHPAVVLKESLDRSRDNGQTHAPPSGRSANALLSRRTSD